MHRFKISSFALLAAAILNLTLTGRAEAGAFFDQFGQPAPILAPGQGVEFVLAGTQVQNVVIPELSFHLRLFINRGDILTGNEPPDPQYNFSPGDVLRFRMGDAVIIYQYDDATNILDPPFQTFGFVAPTDVDDNFAATDPTGLAFTQNDTNGVTFSLEVLAGDGVRFTGLEFADTIAGTFQFGGASPLVRYYDVHSSETIQIDFESLDEATPVTDQFESLGVTFFGDPIFDEQGVIDALGAELDLLEGRMLLNHSTTPPLGISGYVGMRYERPVSEVRFDFAGRPSAVVGLFEGDFVAADVVGVETITGAAGPSGLSEGTAVLSLPTGFDGLIVAEPKSLFLDDLSVTFLASALIDFEGFHGGTLLADQFGATRVSFFGDEVVAATTASGGGTYDLLEGNVLINNTATPPLGTLGFLGMQFDGPASSVQFDFSGPALTVGAFLGEFTGANLVTIEEFTSTVGPSGMPEGTVVIEVPSGFDGLVIAEGSDVVVIDNLKIEFLPQ